MYSAENIKAAKEVCKCCPDCSDYPCEGSLNCGCCDNAPCRCDSDYDDEEPACDLCGQHDCRCDDCGIGPDGYCSLAGTEFCDFECPNSG